MSRTFKLHLAALLLRCSIFFILLYTCLHAPSLLLEQLYRVTWHPNTVNVIWLFLAIGILRRFFPSKSSDCFGHQKQFAIHFQPTEIWSCDLNMKTLTREMHVCNRGIVTIAMIWILGNGLVFLLYSEEYFDERVLLLISAAYSVCDIICILFWCPFQRIWMHNRCCTTCRIYNWDFIMMCTPLFVIPSFYTWSLCILAFALYVRWELTAIRHPERFLPATNKNLLCGQCTSQLCQLKRKK